MKTDEVQEFTDFPVQIPAVDGNGVVETVTIKVPVERDTATGELLLTPEALELIEATQARYMGLLTPEEIKSLREQLGLTQREIAELLQAGEKSYTRWESGRARPSRIVNVLLSALRDGLITLPYLRELKEQDVDWRKVLMTEETIPHFCILSNLDGLAANEELALAA